MYTFLNSFQGRIAAGEASSLKTQFIVFDCPDIYLFLGALTGCDGLRRAALSLRFFTVQEAGTVKELNPLHPGRGNTQQMKNQAFVAGALYRGTVLHGSPYMMDLAKGLRPSVRLT